MGGGDHLDSSDCYVSIYQVEEAGRGGIDELEATLHRLVELVHPRHYLAMQVKACNKHGGMLDWIPPVSQVKRMLCLMYGNCPSHRLESMKEKALKRKVELCREYIAVYSILEPGLTKWKGRLCEELARTLIKLEGR